MTRPETLDELLSVVAAYYHVSPRVLVGRDRHLTPTRARQVFMYLARKWMSHTLTEIGAVVGGRDHTTVLWGVKAINSTLKTPGHDNDLLRRQIADIEERHEFVGTEAWPSGDNEPVELFLPCPV